METSAGTLECDKIVQEVYVGEHGTGSGRFRSSVPLFTVQSDSCSLDKKARYIPEASAAYLIN